MKMKIFKMVMSSLAIVSALSLSLYALNYYSNEERIKKLQDNVFVNNSFSWLGFMEPWVEHYNEGISLQRQKLYEEAIEEYDLALDSNIPWEDACWVRINKVLSMTAPIIPEAIDLTNIDDTIALLEDCLEVLSEDECATAEGDGHDEDAQQLYDDIVRWIEELKQQKEQMEEEQEQQEQQEQQDQQDQQDQNQQDQGGDQNQDQNQGNDQNQDQGGNQDQDQNQNGEGDENQDQNQGSDEDDAQSAYEQELADTFNDLQNQAYVDRTNGGVGVEQVDTSDYQGVEEFW